jgi:hypothetical protein
LDTTVPREFGDPSPQSITAAKSLAVAAVSPSVNVPTTTVFKRKPFEVDRVTGAPAVRGASATTSSAPPLPEASIALTVFVTVTRSE